ncbi:MAG: BNR-4 repeat-containing protein [Bacteroidota bacterium]|nr:BNR-4 repeat-containing protein [Bacteroidota bacterium]
MRFLFIVLINISLGNAFCQELSNAKINGYKGIWFELNQKYEYGDKYSGALGTYTAKHVPLAIYAKEVDKTYFVYGGTTSADKRYLLCMIGEFNHKTGMVSKPTVVYDKQGIDDPHDNPSILIDDEGYIWVFISGRGRTRQGFKYKSEKPFNIDEFSQITEEEMTYPQPWNTQFGFFHFFTKYTGIRQLYFETSKDGMNWSEDKMLAAIPVNDGEKSGHYQISSSFDGKVVATFFNRHPNGIVDRRTDLYYIQSRNFGNTWTTIDNLELQLPIEEQASPARVVDYASQSKNVYLKDMGHDSDGNPVCLYICSYGHEPGQRSAPYEWCITKWDGKKWLTTVVTTSDHNYDMGSLYISEDDWSIVGPTEEGPQLWGVGGEIAIWQSSNKGETWEKLKTITKNSELSHSYVRRPLNFKDPFCFFWSDGHSHEFSKSELYFGNFKGEIWKLPYSMQNDYEKPIKIN